MYFFLLIFTILLPCSYCSVYPFALFMCSFALLINYFTDRFSLMRTWKRFSQLGTGISTFSRTIFFTTSVVVMSYMSAYFWSGFPFDNLCQIEDAEPVGSPYTNFSGEIESGVGKPYNISVSEDTEYFRYCNQNFFRRTTENKIPFPPLSLWQPEGNEWMTDAQEEVVNIHGWTSIAIICLALAYFGMVIIRRLRNIFKSSYKECGEDQNIKFADVESKAAYVPQVYSSVFSFPLLACDSSSIDEELYDWTDPDRPHEYYDLTKDAAELLGDNSTRHEHVFSKMSYFPASSSSSRFE